MPKFLELLCASIYQLLLGKESWHINSVEKNRCLGASLCPTHKDCGFLTNNAPQN